MNAGTEAAEQVVRMSLNGVEIAAKLTGKAAERLAVLIYSIIKDNKKTKGKSRLNSMLRSGKELTIFSIKDRDMEKFCKEAKRYGILYCVLKDRNAHDGLTDIMVRESDAGKLSRMITRYGLYDFSKTDLKMEIQNNREKNRQDQEKGEEAPDKQEENQQEEKEKSSGQEVPGEEAEKQTEETEEKAEEKTEPPVEPSEESPAEKAPARPLTERERIDEYLESVLSGDDEAKKEGEPDNPRTARTEESRQSGRSSEARSSGSSTRGQADEERDMRPSVKKELEEIRREQNGEKKMSPVRVNTQSQPHLEPKKKEYGKER